MFKALAFALCLAAPALADTYPDITTHESAFFYCVGNFGPVAVGNVFYEWAIRNGYPDYPAQEGERSGQTAFLIGSQYSSPIATGDPPIEVAQLCMNFVKYGPSQIPSWRDAP